MMGTYGVGQPARQYLEVFAALVHKAFPGAGVYLVGSATATTAWRDVDVRVILDDDDYGARFVLKPEHQMHDGEWCVLCMAFSELGRRITGLPIDFQIQQQTHANATNEGPRHALGIVGPLHDCELPESYIADAVAEIERRKP